MTAGLRWDGAVESAALDPNPAIPPDHLTSRTICVNGSRGWALPGIRLSNTVVRAFGRTIRCSDSGDLSSSACSPTTALNTVVADSYLRSADSAAGLNASAAFVCSRATGWAGDAGGIGRRHGSRLPQSAIVPGRRQRRAAVHSQDLQSSAGYVHNSTWDLQQLLNQNLFPPTYDASGHADFPDCAARSAALDSCW